MTPSSHCSRNAPILPELLPPGVPIRFIRASSPACRENSDISSRRKFRSAVPYIYSTAERMDSVLPTPVGPSRKSVPLGRPGVFKFNIPNLRQSQSGERILSCPMIRLSRNSFKASIFFNDGACSLFLSVFSMFQVSFLKLFLIFFAIRS